MDRKYENQEVIDKVEKVANDFLKEKHSNHHRDVFFPAMINKLDFKRGAEVGVDKAGYSCHILNKTKIEKYYCVDTWQDDFGSDYKKDYYNKDGNVRFEEARNNLKQVENFEGRVEMLRMTSAEASMGFENDSLDFCYIDGDHSLEGIMFDLYYWNPKIKIGGIVSGHDYKDGPRSGINNFWGEQLDYKVKTAVDYFCERYGFKLNIVGGRILSWWFVRNR